MFNEFDDDVLYIIILDQDLEAEYCLWPEGKAIPRGWKSVGRSGSKQECINHLRQIWPDMRPLAVHAEMAEKARRA